ncbi:MAG: hypothetical protein REJ24_18795, partial [Rhodocyclaceae bacterium]|nr:hypothetical protein [Rhodocyclaceae bacterium]
LRFMDPSVRRHDESKPNPLTNAFSGTGLLLFCLIAPAAVGYFVAGNSWAALGLHVGLHIQVAVLIAFPMWLAFSLSLAVFYWIRLHCAGKRAPLQVLPAATVGAALGALWAFLAFALLVCKASLLGCAYERLFVDSWIAVVPYAIAAAIAGCRPRWRRSTAIYLRHRGSDAHKAAG